MAANANITEDKIALDCTELKRLADLTTRDSVRELLCKQIAELEVKGQQEEVGGLGEAEKPTNAGDAGAASASAPPPVAKETPLPKPTESQKVLVSKLPTKTITSYGWDQSDRFAKVYVTLNGVHSLPRDDVSVDFTSSSFTLKVKSTDCIHQLTINSLLHPLIADKCHFKIKTDSVLVLLKKSTEENWGYLTQTEQKVKQKKKPAAPKAQTPDPSAGIMDLMKQMYDEGDDDMKRQIAKAWTEAREKKDTLPLP